MDMEDGLSAMEVKQCPRHREQPLAWALNREWFVPHQSPPQRSPPSSPRLTYSPPPSWQYSQSPRWGFDSPKPPDAVPDKDGHGDKTLLLDSKTEKSGDSEDTSTDVQLIDVELRVNSWLGSVYAHFETADRDFEESVAEKSDKTREDGEVDEEDELCQELTCAADLGDLCIVYEAPPSLPISPIVRRDEGRARVESFEDPAAELLEPCAPSVTEDADAAVPSTKRERDESNTFFDCDSALSQCACDWGSPVKRQKASASGSGRCAPRAAHLVLELDAA